MNTFKDRVIQERIDLNDKRKKLIEFIQTNSHFGELSDEHQMLLRLQDGAMEMYSSILREIILLLSDDETSQTSA